MLVCMDSVWASKVNGCSDRVCKEEGALRGWETSWLDPKRKPKKAESNLIVFLTVVQWLQRIPLNDIYFCMQGSAREQSDLWLQPQVAGGVDASHQCHSGPDLLQRATHSPREEDQRPAATFIWLHHHRFHLLMSVRLPHIQQLWRATLSCSHSFQPYKYFWELKTSVSVPSACLW